LREIQRFLLFFLLNKNNVPHAMGNITLKGGIIRELWVPLKKIEMLF
jgi:hypothetical protein